MPSQLHEALLLLFRNRPTLAPNLLHGALHADLLSYSEVLLDSADLTDIQPAEYRADLVVRLVDDTSVFAIVVEVQLSVEETKRFVWPVYLANLRARLRCPVCLLVVTADDLVARWAAKSVEMGGSNRFTPYVLGLSGVPEMTDTDRARADPEIAVLSAMAHGRHVDFPHASMHRQADAVVEIALTFLEHDGFDDLGFRRQLFRHHVLGSSEHRRA